MTHRRLILTLAIACSVPLGAQTPQPPAFRAATDLVEVDVITRDRSGRFVSDLAMEDFELQEDGKPYPLQQLYLHLASSNGWDVLRAGARPAAPASSASGPADAATHIFVVVFDDAHLSPAGFKRTQAAALTLFQAQFHDGDVGGVVANGRMANGRLTSDRAELIKAVKDAKPNAKILSAKLEEGIWPRVSTIEAVRIVVNDDKELLDMVVRRGCEEERSACTGIAGDDPVRSMLYGKTSELARGVRVEAAKTLAMLHSVLTGLGRLDGQKNVLLMSEGFISEETWPEVQEAVSSAARANTRIYALDARGLGGRGMASIESVAPAEALTRMYEQMDMAGDAINSLAVDTGGFVIRNANQFDAAIAQIADDAGNYYVLGYNPAASGDGKFHRISVKVKRPGVRVRARRGYVATPKPVPITTTAPAPAPTSEVAPALTSEVPPVVTSEVVPTPTSEVTSPPSVSGMRLRPDATKHIDMLLPDPAADRAAAAGWEAYQRGDVVAARASLSVAAASPAAEAWVHYALGQAEYALGQYAAAVVQWEQVRGAAADFEPVYFDLVDGYLQLKAHDKAIRLLRDGAANWPKDPDIFNALGVVQTARGALNEAIAAFQDAVAAAPDEPVSYFNLGRAFELRYFRSRRYVRQTKRWIAEDKDRVAATGHYERYLTFGGPYADAAREGLTRLKWAASAQ